MSQPTDIDKYADYITLDDTALVEKGVSSIIIERLHRIRGLYSYWLQFPSKFDNEIVQYDMAMFNIGRAQAYDDLHITHLVMGNMQQASKDFMRWKINKDLEEDLRAARRAGDHRSVAAIEKNRILNNRTDKEDEIEIEYGKIAIREFIPSSDPRDAGVEVVPNFREYQKKVYKRYASDRMVQDAEYEEVKEEYDGAE